MKRCHLDKIAIILVLGSVLLILFGLSFPSAEAKTYSVMREQATHAGLAFLVSCIAIGLGIGSIIFAVGGSAAGVAYGFALARRVAFRDASPQVFTPAPATIIEHKPPQLPPHKLPPKIPTQVPYKRARRPAGALQVPIGVTATEQTWKPLDAIGHCAIVGATGSGKSNWLHVAVAELALSATDRQLQFALIDPKRCELTPWAQLALAPIATDKESATRLLAQLATECDKRGALFAQAGARDLRGYLRSGRELPRILCVIDEGLDLLLDAGARSDLVAHLKTLAMRGRSAGIFVWLATQHAAAMTGLPRVVAVNLTSRIVFRVLDGSAATTAGCAGAQNIPKARVGRMLAKIDDIPIEAQAFHMSDEELAVACSKVAQGRGKLRRGWNLRYTTEQQAVIRAAIEQNKRVFTISFCELYLNGSGRSFWENVKMDGALEVQNGVESKISEEACELACL